MSWNLVNKTPNTNLGYSYYPAVWEDGGKVYVKAQGENDINIYDVAADSWSALSLPTTGNYQYFESVAIRHELLWIANNKMYVFSGRASVDNNTTDAMFMFAYDLITGAFVSALNLDATFGGVSSNTNHGNWGRNRHKAVVKDPASGRIFLVNFYLKKIYEFLPTIEIFALVKTWTESIGGNATDDVAGCDAVALNGMIYLLGAHQSASSDGAYRSAGPVEINIENWSSVIFSSYPDYAGQVPEVNNGYLNNSWCAIGNSIFCYGGRIFGWDIYGNSSAQNLLRAIQFDPGTNAWTDLGTIPASLLHAGAVAYENSGYLFGGYESGAFTNKTGNLIYLLESVDSMTIAFDPDDGSVIITWTDTSGQVLTGYLVDRREQQGSVWTTVGSGASADRTFRDTTALVGHDYYYRVRPYYVQV